MLSTRVDDRVIQLERELDELEDTYETLRERATTITQFREMREVSEKIREKEDRIKEILGGGK
jgi:phage shock protein A